MSQPPPQRILLIRPSALGDVARSVPLLVTLRQAHPDAKIDWLVHDGFADAIAHHPMLDDLVLFRRSQLSRFGRSLAATREGLSLAKTLRQKRYDLVIDAQGLFRSGLLTRLTGAPQRVGFADAREGATVFYNVKHRIDPAITHTVDRMLALLQAQGYDPSHDLRLYVGPADQDWLAAFKQEHAIERYLCLAPTARWRSKCWPMQRYAQIARQWIERHPDQRIVLIAAPHEREQVAPFFEHLIGDDPPRTDLRHHIVFPTTTVSQMMALLSQTQLLLCNDSAPLHLAVGLDQPTVALFGPTDPAYVGPCGSNTQVLRSANAPLGNTHRVDPKDQSLMEQLSVEQVWEAMSRHDK